MSKRTHTIHTKYFVEWETGEVYKGQDCEIKMKETFESINKAAVDQKIEELKEAGNKITDLGKILF